MLAVIPAHNERASLPGVIAELRAVAPALELLVVDDGSDDDTAAVAESLGVRWLRWSSCLGVGSAVRAGIRYARLHGHDRVVRVDADGQHPASQLAALVAPLDEGRADAVIGSRYLAPSDYQTPAGRRLAQRALAACLSRLTRRAVTDPTSGFWAFGPAAVQLLAEHHPTGYAEPELLLLLHRNGLRVAEVPVQMRDRTGGRSTLTWPRAALAMARMLLAMIVVPLRPTEAP
jgi:glycosyltransferase involved in cell wall biosynthesis